MERKTFWGAWRSLGWHERKGMLRSYGFVARHRIANRLMDARAVLAGACNASTWDMPPGDYAGGYSHWRCGKRRGHTRGRVDKAHRFNNYIWSPGAGVVYAPLEIGLSRTALPFRKLAEGRKPISSMRRTRLQARRYEIAAAVRRAERAGS